MLVIHVHVQYYTVVFKHEIIIHVFSTFFLTLLTSCTCHLTMAIQHYERYVHKTLNSSLASTYNFFRTQDAKLDSFHPP